MTSDRRKSVRRPYDEPDRRRKRLPGACCSIPASGCGSSGSPRDTGITNQQASIALCGLLNDGLHGLTRPGRGTYQGDPPAAAIAFHSAELSKEGNLK
jgi:hypothetical protein